MDRERERGRKDSNIRIIKHLVVMVSLKYLSRTAALKSLSSVYHHVNLRRRIKYGVKYSPCRAMRAACQDRRVCSCLGPSCSPFTQIIWETKTISSSCPRNNSNLLFLFVCSKCVRIDLNIDQVNLCWCQSVT